MLFIHSPRDLHRKWLNLRDKWWKFKLVSTLKAINSSNFEKDRVVIISNDWSFSFPNSSSQIYNKGAQAPLPLSYNSFIKVLINELRGRKSKDLVFNNNASYYRPHVFCIIALLE